MTTYAIVPRDTFYRVEATAPTGKRWLLPRTYPTEEAAMVRLTALQAMEEADHQMKRVDATVLRLRGLLSMKTYTIIPFPREGTYSVVATAENGERRVITTCPTEQAAVALLRRLQARRPEGVAERR